MMTTSNPALRDDTFSGFGRFSDNTESMTVQGTVIKTAILLLLALLTAGWTWNMFFKAQEITPSISLWMLVGVFGGLIAALVTSFKKEWAPVTAPLYALLEGLFIGGLSATMEVSFPGIVIQAVALTFGTLGAMLCVYQSGLIRMTDTFRMVLVSATGGIALIYFASIALSFFNIQIPFIFGNGVGGIAFSLFVVIIAALNFVVDFDFIENGARNNVPKYMEWYGAFALMVTLVWLYIEFMRLLSKLRSRD